MRFASIANEKTPLGHAVPHIVFLSADEKMFRIEANVVVALVQNLERTIERMAQPEVSSEAMYFVFLAEKTCARISLHPSGFETLGIPATC